MRALVFLLLAVGLVAAIILPNEIGTHELPAVKGEVVSTANANPAESPDGSGFAACSIVDECQTIALIGHGQSSVLRIGPSSSHQQPNLPLLI